jgi:signal transduction histidine kinase/CheY-like chemotaxis protein
MSDEPRPIYQSDHEVKEEFNNLRRELLPAFLPLMVALSWGWFILTIFRRDPPGPAEIALVLSFASIYGVVSLREKHYLLACLLMMGNMITTLVLLTFVFPADVVIPLGGVVVITANAILGSKFGLGSIFVVWLAILGTTSLRSGAFVVGSSGWLGLVYYIGTYIASWIAVRPLRTIATWALNGWKYANDSLVATQRHRGELYRTMRALELANYRIERINQELILARREAEEAQNSKTRLVATVSHELRGPLNLILGFSRLMALSPESYPEALPGSYRTDVNTIYRNCQHLVSLVNDVLDLSRVEVQRLPVLKERVNVEEDVVLNVVEIIRPLAERKQLLLRSELAGGLPWVHADPVRLRQVLLNLLSNAVRLTEQGSVTVRTMLIENRVVVSVTDTGPGIPADQMPGLFKEFTQMNPNDMRAGLGSGLGLAISRHLVEMHGGGIWAESEVGAGTTISFSIPLPGLGPVLVGEYHTDDRMEAGPAPLCLVVHDDLAVVQLLARQMEGYRVAGLPGDASVIQVVDQLHPSIILTKPANGRKLRIELDQAGIDIPLVTCGLPEVSQEFGKGVLGYFSKPLQQDLVAAVMRQVEKESGTTILLVDDDPDAVRLMERFLTSLPYRYRILKAYSGEQALEVMASGPPDVVFLDMVMTGIDGKETLRKMRADPSLKWVPVVFITARDRGEGVIKVGTPFSFSISEPLDIGVGARLISQLISLVPPRYPSEEAGAPAWGAASPVPPVSGERRPPPLETQGLDG